MTNSGLSVEGVVTERISLAVVIPTFQRRGTILQAVRSVLEQGDGSLTLTVVDDGSTDGTSALLAAIDDYRLRLIRQENRGRCAARNTGAAVTTAPWLMFLDSDDELAPGALATVDRLIRSYAPDLVVGANLRAAPDGSLSIRPCSWDERRMLPWALAAGSFAIRRPLFNSVGGYCEHLEHSEHTEMAFKMRSLTTRPRVALTEDVLVTVNEREGRYSPQIQLASAQHLLDHIAPELDGDRRARAMFLGIAGVSSAKLGQASQARRYLARALIDHPRPRTAARLVRSMLPGSARRWARLAHDATSTTGVSA